MMRSVIVIINKRIYDDDDIYIYYFTATVQNAVWSYFVNTVRFWIP